MHSEKPFFKTSHDNKDTNRFDSSSFKGEKEGGNIYGGISFGESIVVLPATTEVINKNLDRIDDNNALKMKLSNTNRADSTDAGSTLNFVMSSVSECITTVRDKPAGTVVIFERSECKPLSKSDSGFSEERVANMSAKEMPTSSSPCLTSTSEECEEGKEDFMEEDTEPKIVKEISIAQAHKMFDRQFDTQMTLSTVSSDLKAEFSEAGAISPLERSIKHLKNLRRLKSRNKNDKTDMSTCAENSEDDLTNEEYEDESYSDDDNIGQGILEIIQNVFHFM